MLGCSAIYWNVNSLTKAMSLKDSVSPIPISPLPRIRPLKHITFGLTLHISCTCHGCSSLLSLRGWTLCSLSAPLRGPYCQYSCFSMQVSQSHPVPLLDLLPYRLCPGASMEAPERREGYPSFPASLGHGTWQTPRLHEVPEQILKLLSHGARRRSSSSTCWALRLKQEGRTGT